MIARNECVALRPRCEGDLYDPASATVVKEFCLIYQQFMRMLAYTDQRVLLIAHGLSIEWGRLAQPHATQQQRWCRILVQICLEGFAVIEWGVRVQEVAERHRDRTGETGK